MGRESRKNRRIRSRLAAWRRFKPVALCLGKKQRESPRVPSSIKKALHLKKIPNFPPPQHPSVVLPPIPAPQFSPVEGRVTAPPPPARLFLHSEGINVVTICEREEEGRLSGDFHMNEDQHNTTSNPASVCSFGHVSALTFVCACCSWADRSKEEREANCVFPF